MGYAVIPTDWVSGYTEVCVKWPDSPEWLAILRGLLTSPVEPIFWDPFTGDPEEPQTAIYPTFDQNLHTEVCMKIETGMIMLWPKETPPIGWLAYNGQYVQKTDYPDLWAFLGDTFGENEFEFQVGPGPGRFPVGFDEGSTYADPIYNYGGEATHTLTTGEMPSHNHTQDTHNHTQNSHNHTQDTHNHTQNSHNHTQDSHNHTQNSHSHTIFGTLAALNGTNRRQLVGSPGGDNATSDVATATNVAATATNQATTPTNITTVATNQATTPTNITTVATNQATGGGGSPNNLPPFFVTQFIIKT